MVIIDIDARRWYKVPWTSSIYKCAWNRCGWSQTAATSANKLNRMSILHVYVCERHDADSKAVHDSKGRTKGPAASKGRSPSGTSEGAKRPEGCQDRVDRSDAIRGQSLIGRVVLRERPASSTSAPMVHEAFFHALSNEFCPASSVAKSTVANYLRDTSMLLACIHGRLKHELQRTATTWMKLSFLPTTCQNVLRSYPRPCQRLHFF